MSEQSPIDQIFHGKPTEIDEETLAAMDQAEAQGQAVIDANQPPNAPQNPNQPQGGFGLE